MLDKTDSSSDRINHILDKIRGVFMARGFDGASMQVLARAAGMSAGNFYLYFASKDAIIEAMIQRDLNEMAANFDSVRQSDRPRDRFRELITQHVLGAPGCSKPMMHEIEAAALRSPEVAGQLHRFMLAIETNLNELLARLAGVSDPAVAAGLATYSRVIMLLVKGMMSTTRLTHGEADLPPDDALALYVIRLIDRTVDEAIASVAGAGVGQTTGRSGERLVPHS